MADAGGGERWSFLGTHERTLDGKGRLILPAEFRSQLEGDVTLMPAEGGAITVYPHEEYLRVARQMQQRLERGEIGRPQFRAFTGRARHQAVDAQGRVGVPPRQREHAALDRDLAVVGELSCFSIWDRGRWREFDEQQDAVDPFSLSPRPSGGGSPA